MINAVQRYNLFAIYFAIYGKRCNFERHKSIPMMANMNLIRERVEMLREWMGDQETALWALVIPTMDPHDSEYVAGHWQMRECQKTLPIRRKRVALELFIHQLCVQCLFFSHSRPSYSYSRVLTHTAG